ncbi:trypsin-like serine peptidase [Streptomyces sp. NPDC012888]|uniref:trypsin-like serine peptidase n=1 Tax=Streptomyces sp. NPDC012888 TaxID=3364855 RepID=UPI0036A62AA2
MRLRHALLTAGAALAAAVLAAGGPPAASAAPGGPAGSGGPGGPAGATASAPGPAGATTGGATAAGATGAAGAAAALAAREAARFWTPERMAGALPVDPERDGTAAPGRPGARPGGAGTGRDFGGIPVVGRLFGVKKGGGYFCTAGAVASPGRDLVLTAAHCLRGTDPKQIAFVPQYTAARPRPHGTFPVRRIFVDPRYRSRGPVRGAPLDVAFVQVGPRADGKLLQDVVGANRLVTGAGYAHPAVRLIGHPARAARPRQCVNRTTRFTSTDKAGPGSFLRIACTGYPGGTSGGPFLRRYDPRTRTGEVIGVIGGYQEGGDSPDTSYSPYFGADVRALYARATGRAGTAGGLREEFVS